MDQCRSSAELLDAGRWTFESNDDLYLRHCQQIAGGKMNAGSGSASFLFALPPFHSPGSGCLWVALRCFLCLRCLRLGVWVDYRHVDMVIRHEDVHAPEIPPAASMPGQGSLFFETGPKRCRSFSVLFHLRVSFSFLANHESQAIGKRP